MREVVSLCEGNAIGDDSLLCKLLACFFQSCMLPRHLIGSRLAYCMFVFLGIHCLFQILLNTLVRD